MKEVAYVIGCNITGFFALTICLLSAKPVQIKLRAASTTPVCVDVRVDTVTIILSGSCSAFNRFMPDELRF